MVISPASPHREGSLDELDPSLGCLVAENGAQQRVTHRQLLDAHLVFHQLHNNHARTVSGGVTSRCHTTTSELGEGLVELLVPEREPALEKPLGHDPCARQHQALGEIGSQSQPQRRGGTAIADGRLGTAANCFVNSALVTGDGEVGSPPAQLLGLDAVRHCARFVGERDPAPPLTTGAEPATQTQPEGDQQTRQRTSPRGENQTGAGVDDPDPGFLSRPGRRLPLEYHFREEAASAVLVSVSVTSLLIAVEADRRSAHQDVRLLIQTGQGRGREPRPHRPATQHPFSLPLAQGRGDRLGGRCTTASAPSKPAASIRPPSGSQVIMSGPGSPRVSRTTWSPWLSSRSVSAAPIGPPAPPPPASIHPRHDAGPASSAPARPPPSPHRSPSSNGQYRHHGPPHTRARRPRPMPS